MNRATVIPSLSRDQIFVQIGAGAGDLDSRACFRDGFCEFVKSLDLLPSQKVVLVEPNSLNLDLLAKCWSGFPQATVLPIGVTPDDVDGEMVFFYAEEDGPHYQVCSTEEYHVKKHYPDSVLKSFRVRCVGINSFLDSILKDAPCFLALDVEGVDFKILSSLCLERFTQIQWISFEFIHLSVDELYTVYRKLSSSGYLYFGDGVDYRGCDILFGKGTFSGFLRLKRTALFYMFFLSRIRLRNLVSYFRVIWNRR